MKYLVCLISLFVRLSVSGQTNFVQMSNSVISYFEQKGDREELMSAKYLLNNMKYHKYNSNEYLVKSFIDIDSVFSVTDFPHCIERIEQINSFIIGHYSEKLKHDYYCFNDSDIIRNVEDAIKVWRNGLWARHLTFDEFCEYILPYKIGNEMPTKGWRDFLRKKYFPTSKIFLHSDDRYYQSYFAACMVNEKIKKTPFHIYPINDNIKNEFPVFMLYNMKMGECYDYAELTTYVMRACGIPVAIDFTPQWPDRKGGHCWNALIDNFGMTLPFMGGESNPGTTSKIGRKMAKVFRITFSYQENSLYHLNKDINSPIPLMFDTPFIRDVSSDYFKGTSVSISLSDKTDEHFLYLAVFDNHCWVPIDYAEISSSGTAIFNNIGRDIVYLPIFWKAGGAVPASDAIYVKPNGEYVFLTPNYNELQTITVNRKYPQSYKNARFRDLLKGGYFECSNTKDFSKPLKCTQNISPKYIGYDTLYVNTNETFRYWRYVSPKGGKCNISEIHFLDGNKNIPIVHVISGSSGGNGTQAKNVFDNDEQTYYVSKNSQDAWIGADLGKPTSVNKIVFLSRNDDNDIIPGQTYQLCYFDKGREKNVDIQTANLSTLSFSNVPTNTIYILHNLDKGEEERIFTYSNYHISWF